MDNYSTHYIDLYKIFDSETENDKNLIVVMLEFSRKHYDNSIEFFDDLCDKIETDYTFSKKFIAHIQELFGDIVFRKYLADSGISQRNSILSILRRRLGNAILPEIDNDKTLTSILNTIFYANINYKDIKLVPKDRWKRLYEAILISEPTFLNKKGLQNQILQAIIILRDRINGGFYDSEMIRYYEKFDYFQSPFAKLSYKIHQIIEKPNNSIDVLEIKNHINDCQQLLNNIITQKDFKGISLQITIKIYRIRQQLQRLQTLIQNFTDLKKLSSEQFLVNITKTWVDFYAPKNMLSKQLNNSIYLVTFLVTHHNGKTGEKYITYSKKDYFKMLFSATGGGFIVAFLCFIKLYISNIHGLSPMLQALGYSLNYAIGFVLIYLFHFTLATKQPAMTAANMARSLASENEIKINTKNFTMLFSRLSRSQLVAFVGNVCMSFPIAVLIFYVLHNLLGFEVIPNAKAEKWIHEVTEPNYIIFWYASVAGLFLFISGLSSGFFINSQYYNNTSQRIVNHPLLKRGFSYKKRRRIAYWIQKNGGGIIGNIILGIFLGTAFLLEKFIQIPFDIRHITFQAGNFGIALSANAYHIGIKQAIIGIVSIVGVGFFNFIISFSFSLIIALKSNNLPIKSIIPVMKSVVIDFAKSPIKYFIPLEKGY